MNASKTAELNQLTWYRLQNDFGRVVVTEYAIDDDRIFRRRQAMGETSFDAAQLIDTDDADEFDGIDTMTSTLPKRGPWKSLDADPRPVVHAAEISEDRFNLMHVFEGTCETYVKAGRVRKVISDGCRVMLVSSRRGRDDLPVELTTETL